MPVFYYVFDLLWLDGQDVRALPLRDAQAAAARDRSTFGGPLRLTLPPQRRRRGAVRGGLPQGLGGRDRQARRQPATPRRRSRDWLKFKCEQGQELVIGGYTAPQGSRTEFGALLLGYYDGGELRYAGKVGTGFDRDDAARTSAGGCATLRAHDLAVRRRDVRSASAT